MLFSLIYNNINFAKKTKPFQNFAKSQESV